MRAVLLLLLSTTANADYWYAEVGAGFNTNLTGDDVPWQNAGTAGCMLAVGHVFELSKREEADTNWSHYSQCLAGPPFNNADESSLDHFGVKYRYKFK